ncbi:unnamed protein product [Trichobilharzia regenti]|nr:unnamed protein product [Trichobilharzia regenti]
MAGKPTTKPPPTPTHMHKHRCQHQEEMTGHGCLNYIAPQTRLRVVDNSPWSSIAPSNITTSGKDNSGKKVTPSEQKTSRIVKDDKDVKHLLALGSKALTIKPAKCIRVYNKKDRGKIGKL